MSVGQVVLITAAVAAGWVIAAAAIAVIAGRSIRNADPRPHLHAVPDDLEELR